MCNSLWLLCLDFSLEKAHAKGVALSKMCVCYALWSVAPPKAPSSPKQLKWPKSDSKVTLGGRRPIDSKKGQKWLKKGFLWLKNPFLSHFWPFFESIGRRPPRVTFESLLGHFNCFGLLGALGGATDHKLCLLGAFSKAPSLGSSRRHLPKGHPWTGISLEFSEFHWNFARTFGKRLMPQGPGHTKTTTA